jgi:uncharacterized NAD(P)/FAD-binding protein YdhS
LHGPNDSSRPTIVVIGGGFSGTAVAAHLLRRGKPAKIVLVNRYGPIGRGVAYRTRIEAHVLNVPAGGMSALPEEPDDFLRFARGRDPSIGRGTFVSRRVYGEYLEHVLRSAESNAGGDTVLERIVGEVRNVEIESGKKGTSVAFADGSRRPADFVVLALGNYSPADPPAEGSAFYESPRYVRDPWIRGSLDTIREGESVLMLGTGLTMMDIALDIASRGVGRPLKAVSRHGLLPQPHVEPATAPPLPALPPDLDQPPHTAARMLSAVRRHAAARGGDWRDVVGALRPLTPALWRRLDRTERARFLRHVRPFWDVHRHRAAPATAAAVSALIADSELQVRAARVVRYEPTTDGVRVVVRLRGRTETEAIFVERVVNCTGPSSDVRRVGDALLDSLLAAGRMVPDAHRLGVEVAEDGALLDASGTPSPALFLVGPLLKARDWEATAVPELRVHAARLAELLLP